MGNRIRKASRTYRPLKIAVGGISGSGKTYGALRIAYGITGDWDKICLIDTENKSADLYAHLGPYDVLPLDDVSPHGYISAINEVVEAGKYSVIIIDSLSHEWAGKGGILEIIDNMASGGKNSYAAWRKGTPIHNTFLDAIMKNPIHTIATLRAKDEYILKENSKGKMEPEKVGLKNIQRDGTEFEFDLVLRIEKNHKVHAEKDRMGLFPVDYFFELNEDLGKKLIGWANDSEPEKYDINNQDHKRKLVDICKRHNISDPAIMKSIHEKSAGLTFEGIEEVIKGNYENIGGTLVKKKSGGIIGEN